MPSDDVFPYFRHARRRRIDGATRGIRCAAKSDLGDWCSRDAGRSGAHESRNPRGRGLVGWWDEEYLRPGAGEPSEPGGGVGE